MILIISEKEDYSTLLVIEWLSHFNQKITYISDMESVVNFESLSISNNDMNTKVEIDGEMINLNEIKSYFWRRGFLQYSFQNVNHDIINCKSEYLNKTISNHLLGEKNQLFKHIYFLLEQKQKKIGTYLNYLENKLDVLYIAQKYGLRIPDTIVTTKKSDLISFKKKYKNIITKPLDVAFLARFKEGKNYSHLTSIITEQDIQMQNEFFFPTKFQERVDKKYELRIFYLKSVCYSMAIFSQNNQKTEVDYRDYDDDKPNRRVPFNLPMDLQNKIHLLMTELKLDTGSIDMIVTKDNKYVFLEVNPVGQFGMVSYPCNYYLEQKIALYLSDIN